ncbi:MAG: sel1 repeat family protein [Verrucomicrobia bacterium]|nr:sel1 repeat family protein [Verrucomicrobiota bacterium]MCH8514664.1 sel1 repeat family protein [Kiritimatiellia bacterium]
MKRRDFGKYLILFVTIFLITFAYIGGLDRLGRLYLRKGLQAFENYRPGESLDQTVRYFRLSALLGNLSGKNILALFYAEGEGVQRNEAKAVQMFEDILRKDPFRPNTCYNLGKMYLYGKGVKANETNAFILFRRAATGGFPIAQYYLAKCYESGVDGNLDPVEAYAWHLVSVANGTTAAHSRIRDLKDVLTPDQVAFAESRSIELDANLPRTYDWDR